MQYPAIEIDDAIEIAEKIEIQPHSRGEHAALLNENALAALVIKDRNVRVSSIPQSGPRRVWFVGPTF